MSVRDLRDPDCDEDYFLVSHQEKGFQVATKREIPLGIVQDTASQGRIYFISFLQVHCSPVLLPMILEARVFQLCPCLFHLQPPWGCGWVSRFFNLVICTHVQVVNIYTCTAFCLPLSAGGHKDINFCSCRDLLLTPVLHFLKIHLWKPNKIFHSFSSLSIWLKYHRGYFIFSHPVV